MAIEKQNPERRLLIIEDEPDLLELLASLCQNLNTHVVTAANGLEGLKILHEQKIHVVLSDMMMPQMSGLQLLRQIRNEGYETPFIFLTGNDDFQSTQMAMQFGATDFYEKPHLEEALLLSLNRALDFGVELEKIESENTLLKKTSLLKIWKQELQKSFQKARDNS